MQLIKIQHSIFFFSKGTQKLPRGLSSVNPERFSRGNVLQNINILINIPTEMFLSTVHRIKLR